MVNDEVARGSVFEDFASYYKADAGRLVGFVIRLGAAQHDAADIAQTASLKLFEHWGRVDNPHAWVRLVATRIYLKSVPRRRREMVTDSIPEVESRLLSPEQAADVVQQSQDIQELLKPLPQQQRMALVWRMEGLDDREIARELDTTPAAIRKAVQRARERVRAVVTARTRREEL